MNKKRKYNIDRIALRVFVLLFIPLSCIANTYTEKRSFFFGGYLGYYNYSVAYDDNSYDSRDNLYNIDAANGWFLGDDLAVGLKVGYGYLNYKLDSTGNSAGGYESDYTSRLFRAGLFMRNYFRLGKVIKLFVETGVVCGFGNVTYRDTASGVETKDSGNQFTLEAGFRPGIVFFVKRGLAIEISAGFVGLNYSRATLKDSDTGVTGTVKSTELDFSLFVQNIRVQVGVAIYL